MSLFADVVRWFLDPAHYQGSTGVPTRVVEHLLMSGAALAAAALIALPVAVVLGHYRKGGAVAINVSNIGRAIPSFAILVLAVQLVGIGVRPAFLALLALGIPPILTNTYIGLAEVSPELREAARGLGMTGRQVLWRVELPLAAPLIMAGIRTSAVQVVATATLAAEVAWGGLGRFIIDGFSQQDNVQIFAGALLVAAVATLTERGLGMVQTAVTPAGMRSSKKGAGLQGSLGSRSGVKAA
ncbi:MAG: osmoprotectant transport system permease protein [Chloroflexota bacterium]|jgi:osmoprotectant transport system permease protein|nr:osmoprotectant transport system permease protein [Chloroflexota bacterium]